MAKQVANMRADRAFQNMPTLDSQLIIQIGQRDERALGTLYDRYSALVYTLALQMTQDRALAEAIVVDVFYAVWELASSFQIGASVPVWLIDITRQRALATAHLPERRMHARVEMYKEPQTMRRDEQIVEGGHAVSMRRAIDLLPAEQREAIQLVYYDGLTCREIAARLRVPVKTIKANLHKALCKLQEQLRNDVDQSSL